MYYGKIKVPAFEGRKAYWAQGIHKPIISEVLFSKVQKVLKGKARNLIKNNSIDEHLPLRGFLYYPSCNKKLSGSGSTGRSKRYYYYHCYGNCNYRVKSSHINELFQEGLSRLTANKKYVELYKEILQKRHSELFRSRLTDKAYITQTIKKLIERCTNSRDLLVRGHIGEEDYLSIKSDCDQRIDLLGKELYNTHVLKQKENQSLNTYVSRLINPGLFYLKADIINKRRVQDLFLTDRLIFNESDFRCNLRPGIFAVYDINPRSHQLPLKIDLSSGHLLDSIGMGFLDKLVNIQRQKGNRVSINPCKETLYFLLDLVDI